PHLPKSSTAEDSLQRVSGDHFLPRLQRRSDSRPGVRAARRVRPGVSRRAESAEIGVDRAQESRTTPELGDKARIAFLAVLLDEGVEVRWAWPVEVFLPPFEPFVEDRLSGHARIAIPCLGFVEHFRQGMRGRLARPEPSTRKARRSASPCLLGE